MQNAETRSGFIAVVGRPSSGKSTLVNALCGNKVSIVTPVPQTTRNAIRGIRSEERGQIVFLDTPGLHRDERRMNRLLRGVVFDSIEDVEGVLYTVDTTRPAGEEERWIASLVREWHRPTVVALTKNDSERSDVNAARYFVRSELPEEVTLRDICPTGGLGTDRVEVHGVEELATALFRLLPTGHPWYPEEFYTDQGPEFRLSELVREAAMRHTREEVPHALYVEVESIEQKTRRIDARVRIFVERPSQQGILVGAGGRTIGLIREEAERAAGEIFPHPVRLSIQVKVKPNWRRDGATLGRLIH